MIDSNLHITAHLALVISRLEELIKKQSESKQLRLPTIKNLASTMKVSPGTICKALDALRQQGVIAVAQRNGIRIIPGTIGAGFELRQNKHFAEQPPTQKQSIKEKLLHDLFTGEWAKEGTLPTLKELIVRYGTSFASLKKAIASLETARTLTKHKKRYRLSEPALKHKSVRLIVIAYTSSMTALVQNTPRSAEFWRLLERECARRDISIDIRTYGEARQLSESSSKDVLGWLVLTNEARFEDLHDVAVRLTRTSQPVAIVDEIGAVTIPSLVSANPRMRLFIMSSTAESGKIMGQYLLRLGHRNVAYFGAFITGNWCMNRWLGIKSAFTSAGLSDGAVLFAQDCVDDWDKLYTSDQGGQPFEKINAKLLKIQRSINPVTKKDVRDFYLHTLPFLWDIKLESLLLRQFDTAIADRSITAWIGENDAVALYAMKFLKQHSIQVPEDVSVVGFDDTIEGLGQGLTSYDFNVPALVHASMNHIFSNRQFTSMHKKGPFEIKGTLMERKTSGLPPRQNSA